MDQTKYRVKIEDECVVYSDDKGYFLDLDEDQMIDLYYQLKEWKCYA